MKSTVLLSFLFFAVLSAAAALHPAAARADFRLCNESGSQIVAAIGYEDSSSDPKWLARGWWVIDSGSCAIAIAGAIPDRYMYVYAHTTDNDNQWTGTYTFCTVPDKFEIWGVNDDPCNGGTLEHFREIDTGGNADYTYTFTT